MTWAEDIRGTLRMNLEAIVNGHLEAADCFCSDCIIGRHEEHARTALEILNAAERPEVEDFDGVSHDWRLIADPEASA